MVATAGRDGGDKRRAGSGSISALSRHRPTACLLRGYRRGGRFEYRRAHTRAVDMPSARPRVVNRRPNRPRRKADRVVRLLRAGTGSILFSDYSRHRRQHVCCARTGRARYSKRPPRRGGPFEYRRAPHPRSRHAVGDAELDPSEPLPTCESLRDDKKNGWGARPTQFRERAQRANTK